MINLLPYDKKAEIHAGRTNVVLLNYVLITLIAAIILAVIVVFAFVNLTISRNQAKQLVAENKESVQQYQSAETQAKKFRQDLAVAKQILDKDVPYSSLVLRIAKTIPNGVVLDSLTLDPTTLGQPVSINAHASSRDTALRFKSELEKATDLFDDVKFTSISFQQEAADPSHPVAITMSIIIKKEAVQ